MPIAAATIIDVTVSDFINADVIGLKYMNISQKPIKISFELFNAGSVGCKALARVDISKDSYSFTAWSKPILLQPNDREYVELYWFPYNVSGNFSGRIRYYCANEIKEIKNFSIDVKDYISLSPSIEIVSPKIFERKITLNVKSNATQDLIIIPLDFPKGWVIEQKKIHVEKGKMKYVELDYSKDMWKVGRLTIIAVSEEGDYGIKTIDIKKEPYLNELVFDIIESFERIFAKNL
jgi:hypothetical protein